MEVKEGVNAFYAWELKRELMCRRMGVKRGVNVQAHGS
jgi:hypothetical protein